jgi:hypothetical protein
MWIKPFVIFHDKRHAKDIGKKRSSQYVLFRQTITEGIDQAARAPLAHDDESRLAEAD